MDIKINKRLKTKVGRRPYLSTGLHLKSQVVYTDISNLGQELLRLLRVLVDPCLDLGEKLGPAPLDHVAKERPRGAAEANQGNPASQLLPRQGDCLVDVVELGGNVHLSAEHLLVLPVRWALQRVGEMGTLLVHHLHLHAHGLGNDEDIGEDDGGVQQALEALDGLQR